MNLNFATQKTARQAINALPIELRNYYKAIGDLWQGKNYKPAYNNKNPKDGYYYKASYQVYGSCKDYNTDPNKHYKDVIKNIYKKNNTKIIFSRSFEQFLSDNQDKKVFRIISKWRHFARVEKCNYITLRKGEKITFHPRPTNQLFNDNNDWKREGRQEIKPLALLILLFGPKVKNFISNSDLEAAINEIKNFDTDIRSEVVSYDVAYSYGRDWNGQNSCMAEKGYLSLYEDNEDVFSAILFKEGNNVVGRCLRVTVDQFTYYDRIYYKDAQHYSRIIDFIKNEGLYYFKTYNSIGSNSFTAPDGTQSHFNISVSAEINTNDYLPYMDTLNYYDSDNNELCNYEPECGYILISTCGGYEEINIGIYDEIDDRYINEEDAVCIDFGRYAGTYTHRDNCFYSEGNDGYCLV